MRTMNVLVRTTTVMEAGQVKYFYELYKNYQLQSKSFTSRTRSRKCCRFCSRWICQSRIRQICTPRRARCQRNSSAQFDSTSRQVTIVSDSDNASITHLLSDRRSSMSLTPNQRRLRAEIEKISSIIAMDHWNIEERYKDEFRTGVLEAMKNQLVRGEVVMSYTLMDEFLSQIIVNCYFGRQNRWGSRKFRLFCHYVLDELYLVRKLALVRAIGEVPKEVRNIITRINDLRNAVAHSFFPRIGVHSWAERSYIMVWIFSHQQELRHSNRMCMSHASMFGNERLAGKRKFVRTQLNGFRKQSPRK